MLYECLCSKRHLSLKNTSLKERDVYSDSYTISNRGEYRLVYTSNTNNVRVFYTTTHYESCTELTSFNLNLTSNIFNISFALSTIGLLVAYTKCRKKINSV